MCPIYKSCCNNYYVYNLSSVYFPYLLSQIRRVDYLFPNIFFVNFVDSGYPSRRISGSQEKNKGAIHTEHLRFLAANRHNIRLSHLEGSSGHSHRSNNYKTDMDFHKHRSL